MKELIKISITPTKLGSTMIKNTTITVPAEEATEITNQLYEASSLIKSYKVQSYNVVETGDHIIIYGKSTEKETKGQPVPVVVAEVAEVESHQVWLNGSRVIPMKKLNILASEESSAFFSKSAIWFIDDDMRLFRNVNNYTTVYTTGLTIEIETDHLKYNEAAHKLLEKSGFYEVRDTILRLTDTRVNDFILSLSSDNFKRLRSAVRKYNKACEAEKAAANNKENQE